MALTYTTNTDAMPIIKQLVAKHFRLLESAGTTFEVLECDGGLKLHGQLVTDVVKIRNLADRAAGSADVRIILDAESWKRSDKKRRAAVLDHALCHLDVLLDKNGKIKRDDVDRPRIRFQHHNFQIGGFHDTIRRHKEHALEAQAIAYYAANLKQHEFDWAAAELMAAHGTDDSANKETAEAA